MGQQYQYCKIQDKVVPQNEVLQPERRPVNYEQTEKLLKSWEQRSKNGGSGVFQYCWERDAVVPRHEVRCANKSAYVRQDTVEPFESYATGNREMFDSMSAYKRHLADHGMEITGGDHLTGKTVANHRYKSNREEIVRDVAEAVRRSKWGMNPQTEREKEICLREQRNTEKLRKRHKVLSQY